MPSFPKVTYPLAVKDKDAVLDWGFDWNDPAAVGGPWLQAGETITASQWIVPSGIVIDSNSHTTTTTTVWLSGGTVGTVYLVTNRIVTSSGRTDDRSWEIKVVDR